MMVCAKERGECISVGWTKRSLGREASSKSGYFFGFSLSD